MNQETVFDLNTPFNFMDFFRRIFSEDFMPHGHCYFWRPDVLWLNVISDGSIALAYYSIPIVLIYFFIKRRDIPFNWMFLMFGAFIFLCGTTHVVEIVTTWIPIYRFSGVVKLLTAIVSLATAIALIPLMPKVLSLPTLEVMNKELLNKGRMLERINREMEHFYRASTGREERILELKREVNKLSRELGKNIPYDLIE